MLCCEVVMSGSEAAQGMLGTVRGKRRKAAEVTGPFAPAAKAQKAVSGNLAQQSATPWCDVLTGKSPLIGTPYRP